MTKKITRAIILVSVTTLLCAMSLVVGSLYNYFTQIQMENQRDNLDMVAVGLSEGGMAYLENLDADKYRITWIDKEGEILFDSKADIHTMENHGDREEFLEALTNGKGEGKRTSATLSEETLYLAQKMSDETVIRISVTQRTIFSLLVNLLNIFLVIGIGAVILALFLAPKIARKAMEPINTLDLDDPLSEEVYDEITPLLARVDKQNKKIHAQIMRLEEQKAEISFIMENVEDGILMIDEKGQVLSCNKVAKSLLSCKLNEYYLSFFRDKSYEDLIEAALKGQGGKTKIKIGSEYYNFSASPTQLGNHEFSVFLFLHNITEEEKAAELRRQFSANVSHELKTPLTSIMGASELLLSDMVKPEDVQSFAQNIHDEANRLLKLVQDIIKISRLDEQIHFEFETVNLGEITTDVVSQLEAKAKNKNINFMVDVEPAKITGVSTVLYEMIYNLCDNAIDYNKNNGQIKIDIQSENNKVIWKIQDTGVGIDTKYIPHIFERFYCVDKSHSKETGGTGLGLSIVKNGANLHHADIEVESVVDVGTTISIGFDAV